MRLEILASDPGRDGFRRDVELAPQADGSLRGSEETPWGLLTVMITTPTVTSAAATATMSAATPSERLVDSHGMAFGQSDELAPAGSEAVPAAKPAKPAPSKLKLPPTAPVTLESSPTSEP